MMVGSAGNKGNAKPGVGGAVSYPSHKSGSTGMSGQHSSRSSDRGLQYGPGGNKGPGSRYAANTPNTVRGVNPMGPKR